ncbi:MAG: hypothetical protein ACR2H1_02605, partial [Limisphaerales bacterium]
KRIVAGVSNIFSATGGQIYLDPPEVLLSSTISNNSFVVSWTTNAIGFAAEQKFGFGETNWITVTNAPVITNKQYQLLLPATNNSHFFRLKQ